MLPKQNCDKRALGCRLLLWFGKQEAVHGVSVCHHEHLLVAKITITAVSELASMVVECDPRDGTYMTCCFICCGDVVKMSVLRWPRPIRGAPFRLSIGREPLILPAVWARCCTAFHVELNAALQQGSWLLVLVDMPKHFLFRSGAQCA